MLELIRLHVWGCLKLYFIQIIALGGVAGFYEFIFGADEPVRAFLADNRALVALVLWTHLLGTIIWYANDAERRASRARLDRLKGE